MLAKILHTLTSRVGAAGLSFLVVVLTAKFLGAAGRGEASIFMANVAIILLFTSLIGGTGITYLASRINFYQLLLPSYLWSGLVCVLATLALYATGQAPETSIWHLGWLSLLLAFFTINTTVLLGRDQVKTNNYLTLLQTFLTVSGLAIGFLVLEQKVIETYFHALYLAYGVTALLSFLALFKLPERPDFSNFTQNLKQLVRVGTVAQFSNIITFLNYRLGYYFLQTWAGLEAVGVFSVAVTLSEAIWMVGRSLATVQYAKLVNTENTDEAKTLTKQLAKLSFTVTTLAVLVLILFPAEGLKLIFGKEFGPVKPVIYVLATGVIATGTGMIFSHYFAGRGRYQENNRAALFGLLFTVPGCWFLIPQLGILGAGLASTLSYVAAFAYLYWKFRQETAFSLKQLVPNRADFREILAYLKR